MAGIVRRWVRGRPAAAAASYVALICVPRGRGSYLLSFFPTPGPLVSPFVRSFSSNPVVSTPRVVQAAKKDRTEARRGSASRFIARETNETRGNRLCRDGVPLYAASAMSFLLPAPTFFFPPFLLAEARGLIPFSPIRFPPGDERKTLHSGDRPRKRMPRSLLSTRTYLWSCE